MTRATALPTERLLYERGMATAVACWEHFAAATDGAGVMRAPGVAAAVFPSGPERAVYNNAVLDRNLERSERAAAIEAMEDAYGAASVDGFAAWVHETDVPMIEELERRGYRCAETTRAMGLSMQELAVPSPDVDAGRPAWHEYQEFLLRVGVPAGLLPHVDVTALDIVMARIGGDDVATALSFDHDGDCGIYNVSTVPPARRRGLGTALTALLLRSAKQRGCITASLQATPMAEGIYAAVGFKDLGKILEYVPGPHEHAPSMPCAQSEDAEWAG